MASETNSSSSAPSVSLTSSSIPAFATVTVQNIAGMLLGLLTGADLRPSKTIVNDANCIVDNPTFDLWYDKDQSLMIWIISTLSTDLLSHTIGIEYSRDLWEMLEKRFAGVSRANVHHLRQRLQNLVKGDLSMVSYLQQMKEIADGLGDAGHPLTDDDLVAYILVGLSEEYDSFVTSIETRQEKVSSDELHSYLLGREAALLKHKLRSNSSGPTESLHAYLPLLILHSTFLARVVPTTLTLSIEVFLPLVVCFHHRLPILPPIFLLLHNLVRKGFIAPIFLEIRALRVFCNEKGHVANTCRKLGRLLNASGSSLSTGPFTGYYANPQSAASSPSWIVNSGATAHVTATNQHLHNSSPFTGSDSLQVANKFFRDNSCSLMLYPDSFTIKDLATKRMLFQGLNEDGVYPDSFTIKDPSE
ncbi:hypothetical protein L3X38_044081 [Prunus dulcis]|uniref:Uncharacterized protein n=1 Tax=Prunus dulcis TaxID=3755 RepID=A0AAD4YMV5_PRUDU|nr:hypothetical protein L3X38_044081 [Prunus dulcis]